MEALAFLVRKCFTRFILNGPNDSVCEGEFERRHLFDMSRNGLQIEM
jgi:hypothetical protein